MALTPLVRGRWHSRTRRRTKCDIVSLCLKFTGLKWELSIQYVRSYSVSMDDSSDWNRTSLYAMQTRGECVYSIIWALLTCNGSKKIVSLALEPYRTSLSELGFEAKEGYVQSLISRAKSRGDDIISTTTGQTITASSSIKSQRSSQVDQLLQHIYVAYEDALRNLNCLDFDDLLVFGVKLLKHAPVANVEHLFVDELCAPSLSTWVNGWYWWFAVKTQIYSSSNLCSIWLRMVMSA
jgi:hypothetical protein